MNEFKLKPSIMFNCELKDLDGFVFEKALIVCDPFFIENKTIDKVIGNLSNIRDISVYSKVKPDPTLNDVVDGIEVCLYQNPDVIIALGGGSAIDLAKAISYFTKRISDKNYYFIAIPTTSGTGSEVTSFAVINDEQNLVKIPVISDELLPNIAFLDNDLIKELPKSVVAFTGMDALTHAVEAIVSTKASVFSDAYSFKALELIKENLLASFKDEGKESRALMHQASTIAGIAFNEASLGINHAIAHQLGALFKIPHGKCNAILLPYVIELNAKDEKAKEIYNKLAYDLHLTSSLSKIGYRSLINWINKLKGIMKIENSLKELKISKDEYNSKLEQIAMNALNDRCMSTNPIQLDVDQMKSFLKKVY